MGQMMDFSVFKIDSIRLDTTFFCPRDDMPPDIEGDTAIAFEGYSTATTAGAA